jgi:hypothetical protein
MPNIVIVTMVTYWHERVREEERLFAIRISMVSTNNLWIEFILNFYFLYHERIFFKLWRSINDMKYLLTKNARTINDHNQTKNDKIYRSRDKKICLIWNTKPWLLHKIEVLDHFTWFYYMTSTKSDEIMLLIENCEIYVCQQ